MTTANINSTDLDNLEHLGEWDHGTEPDVLKQGAVRQGTFASVGAAAATDDLHNVEHLGDWDHGVEPDVVEASRMRSKNNSDAPSPAQFVKKTISNALHKFKSPPAVNDNEKRHAQECHSEEEVAGMKLCVSDKIRQDSFVAPC